MVSIPVFIHCCRSMGGDPTPSGCRAEAALVWLEPTPGEGSRPSEGRSVTLPYPSSRHLSTWKKRWPSDLSSLRSNFDICDSNNRSALWLMTQCRHSGRLQQRKTSPKHRTAETGQAPAMNKILKIDFF